MLGVGAFDATPPPASRFALSPGYGLSSKWKDANEANFSCRVHADRCRAVSHVGIGAEHDARLSEQAGGGPRLRRMVESVDPGLRGVTSGREDQALFDPVHQLRESVHLALRRAQLAVYRAPPESQLPQ